MSKQKRIREKERYSLVKPAQQEIIDIFNTIEEVIPNEIL